VGGASHAIDRDPGRQHRSHVQHHPCSDPHHGEVFFVGNYEPSGAYPTDEAFESFIVPRCTAAFKEYTGLDIATAQDLDFSAFYPTAKGWGSGDRKVICYAVKVGDSNLTQSIKKA
jgi:hypothetical protein